MYSAATWMVGSLLLVASTARAEPTKLSALPPGELSKPPAKSKPRHASGKTEGFFVNRQGRDYVIVSTVKTDLSALGSSPTAACLASETETFASAPGPGEGPGMVLDWSPQSQSFQPLAGAPSARVVHREEVVVSGDAATLETRDAIVDARTTAAKTIDKRSLPMRKVGTAVDGVVVYAFRGTSQVQFVVVVPDQSLAPPSFMEAHVGANMQNLISAQCRHLRVPSAVKKGEGSATSVLLRVVEPEPKGAPVKDDATGSAPRTIRTLAVHLSTSWLSGDAEPVVSVTSGWQGPSERVRIPTAGSRGLGF